LVLGADYRGLGIVRSLGRRGIPVFVVKDGDDVLAAHSRYAGRTARLADGDDAERARFLSELARREGLEGWTLFPTSDESLAFVGRRHAELSEHFLMTTDPWSLVRWAHNKRLTYEMADRLGVTHPATWHASTAAEAATLDIEFPVIIKPAAKESRNALTVAKAWRVDNRWQLRQAFDAAAALMDPELLMIQEFVPGNGGTQLSYAALTDQGRPLATVVARRSRQYPADFGRASTFVETIDCPAIVAPARALLAELGLTGLVEVEFKFDARDGRHKLLDVNPRVWGWQSVCALAGVDFPYLCWRQVHGQEVAPVVGEAGVRWLRLTTDTPTTLKELAHGRMSWREYVASFRGPRQAAIYARDDLKPVLSELPMLTQTLFRRLAGRRPV
jgi:predicted ATP-grasp superfamily ATP-dependent carboligase